MEPANLSNTHLHQPLTEKPSSNSVVKLFKSVMATSLATGILSGTTLSAFYIYFRPTITILTGFTLQTSATLVGSITLGGSLALGLLIFMVKACCCMHKPKQTATQQVEAKQEVEDKESNASPVEKLRKLMAGSNQNKAEKVIDLIIKTNADCMSLDLMNDKDPKLVKKVSKLLKQFKGENRLTVIKLVSDKYFAQAQSLEGELALKLYAQVARFSCLAIFDLEMLHRCLYLIANRKVHLKSSEEYDNFYQSLNTISSKEHEQSGKILFTKAECYFWIGYYFSIVQSDDAIQKASDCFQQSTSLLLEAEGITQPDNILLLDDIAKLKGCIEGANGLLRDPFEAIQPGTVPLTNSHLEHKD